MKKRLLELCLSKDLGGLELYMVRAARALVDDFEVLSVVNSHGRLLPYFEDTPLRYRTIDKGGKFRLITAARHLSAIIDEEAIDIVHLHWTKDIPVAVLAKKFAKRTPKLVQTRNMTMTLKKDDLYHRFLYRNLDMMLPVTYQVADQLRRFIPVGVRPRIEVLYMGSDKPEMLDDAAKARLRAELKMPEQRFIVGMVGRIETLKRQYLLIDAMAHLQAMDVEADAFFVGHEMVEGYTQTLQQRADAAGISEQIHFLGFMKNPHTFYQLCDAVILATPCETFGLVLIEAMQVGTAVIGTNACGPLEIIEAGSSGLLFDKDDSRSLAEKIAELAADPAQRERMANAGKERAQTLFSNTQQFRKLAEILKSL